MAVIGDHWKPALPWGIDRATPLDPQADTGSGVAVPFTDAPATSHIKRFRFWDAREHSFIRKFGQQNGASQLHVVFREKNGGDGPEYWYFFSVDQAGANVFHKMAGSPHPYGEVLYPLVIRAGVPYQRQSK